MKVIWQSDPVKILVIESARLTEIFLFFFQKNRTIRSQLPSSEIQTTIFTNSIQYQLDRPEWFQKQKQINYCIIGSNPSSNPSCTLHYIFYTIFMSNIEKLLMSGSVRIIFKLLEFGGGHVRGQRCGQMAHVPIIAIAAVTVIASASASLSSF